MFEQLFKRRAAVISHHSAPFAVERKLYLRHLLDEGRSRKTLRNIAHLLFAVAHHLRLDGPEVTLLAVEAAAAAWAKTTRRVLQHAATSASGSSCTTRLACFACLEDCVSRGPKLLMPRS
jgi:hypothetical protein